MTESAKLRLFFFSFSLSSSSGRCQFSTLTITDSLGSQLLVVRGKKWRERGRGKENWNVEEKWRRERGEMGRDKRTERNKEGGQEGDE